MTSIDEERAATLPRLLFICQLNAVRSPIAEGMARSLGFEVESCGLQPAAEPDELMIAVMREKGIDMSNHVPSSVQSHAKQSYDRIITFTEDTQAVSEAVFGAKTPIDLWRVPTPPGGSYDVRAILDTYRAIRGIIETRLEKLLRDASKA